MTFNFLNVVCTNKWELTMFIRCEEVIRFSRYIFNHDHNFMLKIIFKETNEVFS